MTSIFISYSRRDRATADHIAAELRKRGAEVFIDYQRLVAGENFIERLGKEIESRKYFILIVSPRSVASKWVKAEVSWALYNNKTIIPVILEPASMTEFFFLVALEQVDFQRWNIDGNVDTAIIKLAKALSLSETAIVKKEVVTEAAIVNARKSEDSKNDEVVEKDKTPAFGRGDISELFVTAAEIADEDPEQAYFLYQRVIEIDPGYMKGSAQEFVNREAERLKPARITNMMIQAKKAMRIGDWKQGEQIGQDILTLDKNNNEALQITETCNKNIKCQPLYQQAALAVQNKHWKAASTFLRDVIKRCPEYGDPSNLLEQLQLQPDFIKFIHEVNKIEGHSMSVTSIAFSPDGKWLASGSSDKTIKLWNVSNGRGVLKLSGHSSLVRSVAFSPDGKLLASGSSDTTIKLWNVSNGKELLNLSGHLSYINSVAFSPDGKLLASGSGDTTIKVWNLANGKELFSLPSYFGPVFSVAFSPDGKLLASGDKAIKLWNTSVGKEEQTLSGASKDTFSVAFSPNGKWLAAGGSGNKRIKLWNISDGKELLILSGHSGYVTSVAFSPNGKLLASGSDDKTIRLWNLSIGMELLSLSGHSSTVVSVAFSPDGTMLASGSGDNTIRLWST